MNTSFLDDLHHKNRNILFKNDGEYHINILLICIIYISDIK